MSKSLGEKLFDAMLGVAGETELWAGIGAKEQAQTERIALAFCASLSHDETATATIEGLRSERESLLAAVRDYHFALDSREHGGVAADHLVKAVEGVFGHWVQGAEKARRAALTTKEG